MSKKELSSGFTLIELLIGISVAAILISTAVPSFSTFIRNNRLISDANQFISSINLVRSEAITRSKRVVLCKSADGSSCNTSTTGWQQGWIAFVDDNRNGVIDFATDPIIRVYSAFSSGNSLVGFGSNSNYGSADNLISYDANGYSTATNKLELIVCDSKNTLAVARGIRITASGRPNVIAGTALGSGLNCS